MKPTFLIDTNIIIQFEDTDENNLIKPLFSKLHSLFAKHSLRFFYHPSSERDFENDTNVARRVESLSRLRKYPKLPDPPIPDPDSLEELYGGVNKINDLIDCQILYALDKHCATFLVTEDKDIRKRAKYSGIDERVINCYEAIEIIERTLEEKQVVHPRIFTKQCYNINIEDEIFDSLVEDYDGFKKWFEEKCCQEQRKCWVIESEEKIAGICIYKKDEVWHDLPTPSIKLCTFKISDNFRGRKYGELMLRAVFLYAIKNNLKSIWVTTYSKQVELIYFLKEFGFRAHSKSKGEEIVFYKEMNPPSTLPVMRPLEFHKRYYPHFYDHSEVEKYFIPILPAFYKTLFPENEIEAQLMLDGMSGGPKIPGNTIKKVYLSHSNKKEIPPGSLLYFYVSSPNSSINTIGIVEKTERYDNEEGLSGAIGKRSVYSNEQISEMSKKEVLVIHFRIIRHIEEVTLGEMKQAKILTHAPQSIGQIKHVNYLKLKPLIEFSE